MHIIKKNVLASVIHIYRLFCKCSLLTNFTNSDKPDQAFNHLEEEEKAGCFAIIVLQMYCYYKCSVALPHGAVGWSAVCDCGIS